MKLGDLVTTSRDKHLYSDISENQRVYIATFESSSLGVCLDMGYSSTDVLYLKILVDGQVGWTRPEGIIYF